MGNFLETHCLCCPCYRPKEYGALDWDNMEYYDGDIGEPDVGELSLSGSEGYPLSAERR